MQSYLGLVVLVVGKTQVELLVFLLLDLVKLQPQGGLVIKKKMMVGLVLTVAVAVAKLELAALEHLQLPLAMQLYTGIMTGLMGHIMATIKVAAVQVVAVTGRNPQGGLECRLVL
jgi:hypothetical protein